MSGNDEIVQALLRIWREKKIAMAKRLCDEHSIEFTEKDGIDGVIMWAAIGHVLVEKATKEQPRPRGRPSKQWSLNTTPINLARAADRIKADFIREGEANFTDGKAVEFMIEVGALPRGVHVPTVLQQISRGRKSLAKKLADLNRNRPT